MALDDHDNHFIGAVTQKALIEHEGKILLVQYPAETRPAWKWDLPGGRIHRGESALEGLKREVREEIGAEIIPKEILATGVAAAGDGSELFFVIYRANLIDPGQQLVPEQGEIGKIEWKDKTEFFMLPVIYPPYQEALKLFL